MKYNKKTNEIRTMIGETFVLSDTAEKQFLHKPRKILNVFSYDECGNKLDIDSSDIEINFENGTIKRSDNSHIPNYSNHKVTYDINNKFSFSSEPRHPELNVNYFVFVDYEYLSNETSIISSKSHYLNQNTLKKLKNKNFKIGLIGDSIARGAQTSASYYFNDNISNTFLGYLTKTLQKIYDNNKISPVLISEIDARGNFASKNIMNLIKEKPDVVIVEFGMNDHVGYDKKYSKYGITFPLWVSNLLLSHFFKHRIQSIISNLKHHNIEVILCGFFSQNQEWEMESPNGTMKYNKILKELAMRNNLYFVDVIDSFKKISEIKSLKEDMLADYIHHPNDWAHRIYFSQLIPVFLDRDYEEKDLEYYLS